MAIDELHIVRQWGGDWRKSYSKLDILRTFIDSTVPWFGTSATLDQKTLEEVKALAGFTNVKIMRTSIDRPDISFTIRKIEYSLSSLQDLRFAVLPVEEAVQVEEPAEGQVREEARSRRRLFQIPKTVIYMDSIAAIEAAVYRMISWLVESGCTPASAANAIQAYHSELAEADKRAISTEFGKADSEWWNSSCNRIIVATDAMGMGINNPDVKRVVQWRQPKDMCTLIQRAGRAARGPNVDGEFVWLVESWCYKEGENTQQIDKNSELNRTASPSGPHRPSKQSKKAKQNAERQAKLPDSFWQMINSGICIRKCILKHFGEDVSRHPSPAVCCSYCSTIEIPLPPKPKLSFSTAKSARWIVTATKEALLTWRESKATELFASFNYTDPAIIMCDRAINEISKVAASIDSLATLKEAFGRRWVWIEEYGDEVILVVQTACRKATPQSKRRQGGQGKGRGGAVRQSGQIPLAEKSANVTVLDPHRAER